MKAIILMIVLISMMGIAAAEEKNTCWVDEQTIDHPAVYEDILHNAVYEDVNVPATYKWVETTYKSVVDVEGYYSTEIDVPGHDIINVLGHYSTEIDVAGHNDYIYHPEENHTETVWMKGKSKDEHSVDVNDHGEKHQHPDGTWWIGNYHKDGPKKNVCDNNDIGNTNKCHQILIVVVNHDAYIETVWVPSTYKWVETTYKWVDTIYKWVDTTYKNVVDIEGHYGTEVDVEEHTDHVLVSYSSIEHKLTKEAWTEIIPAHNDQACLDQVANDETIAAANAAKLDTDGDGIPDYMDKCPGDKLNRCAQRAFSGYTFGTSDCNRIAILAGKLPDPHAEYVMSVISWEYKYKINQMVEYCTAQGADMSTVPTSYFEWTPN